MTDEQIKELRRLKQEGLLKGQDVVREAWRVYRAEWFDDMGKKSPQRGHCVEGGQSCEVAGEVRPAGCLQKEKWSLQCATKR